MFYLLFLESTTKIITSSMAFSMCIFHYSFPQYQSYKVFTLRNQVLATFTGEWNIAQEMEFSKRQ